MVRSTIAAAEQKDMRNTARALKRLHKASKEFDEIILYLCGVTDIRGATVALIGIAQQATDAARNALSIDLDHIERNARN